ncbi:O-methyltransferase [Streptomyces sp. NPDC005407]|jgi:predicted O-methyltransferase YrrM|uniref:O-methyltransferase n=1 Tax=Streptomyces sp. NPDC005407 TaxID=3155340 RepID=UPI0033B609B0
MALEIWSETEEFLSGLLCPPDPDLARTVHVSEQADLPAINISALQGQQVNLLAKMVGARRILEVGSLAGYSALWLAKALPPDGRMVTIENNPLHAVVAADNIKAAGLADRVEVRVGNASDQLALLVSKKGEPFDFFFIDADQHNNVTYFERCLQLSRPGSVIVFDNVVRSGEVRNLETSNGAVRATQRVLELVGSSGQVDGVVFQTVGQRGHDGMLVVRIR